MNCHACGRSATAECHRCGRAACPDHIVEVCAGCSTAAPAARVNNPLAMLPAMFQAVVLVVLIGAALNLGIATYAWLGLPALPGDQVGLQEAPPPTAIATAAPPVAVPAMPTATATAVALATATETPTPTPMPATPTPTVSPTATATRTPTPAPVVYVVQSGDNLSSIARQYGVTVAAIRAANGLTGDELLRVGQQLVIPRQ